MQFCMVILTHFPLSTEPLQNLISPYHLPSYYIGLKRSECIYQSLYSSLHTNNNVSACCCRISKLCFFRWLKEKFSKIFSKKLWSYVSCEWVVKSSCDGYPRQLLGASVTSGPHGRCSYGHHCKTWERVRAHGSYVLRRYSGKLGLVLCNKKWWELFIYRRN